jgi:hypothetical protein
MLSLGLLQGYKPEDLSLLDVPRRCISRRRVEGKGGLYRCQLSK